MRNTRIRCFIALIVGMLLVPVSYARLSCNETAFHCVKVKRGQSWQALFPSARERAIVKRINHRNGYLQPGLRLKVPDELTDADLLDFSPFPLYIEPHNEKLIVFDPEKHAWAAYDSSGELIRWGPATGGGKTCRGSDELCYTKPGEFRIYSVGSSNCASRKFPRPNGGAPMPYCMFFNGGQAFHGSPGGVVNGNVSHGCVRMFVKDAHWLRYDFVEKPYAGNNFRGTKVVIVPYAVMKQAEDHGDEETLAADEMY